MRRWDEVREVLRDEFAVEEAGDGRLVLSLGDQPVVVELATAFGEPWLTAVAPILPEGELVRPRSALESSSSLASGVLCVRDGVLGLRWTGALRPLTRAALDRAVRAIAREATRLREIEEQLSHRRRSTFSWIKLERRLLPA